MQELLAIAGHLAEEHLRPDADRVDTAATWPKAGLRATLERLGGLVAPTSAGGLGGGLPELAAVSEVLGGACASTAICFGMHCVATAVIAAKATPGQAEEFLVPIARGQHLASLALSESGTGAHFWIPETRLAHLDGTLQVNGQKSFVTNGSHADSYVVSTVADRPDAPPGEFSCVLIKASDDGLHWGPAWSGMGMRGNESRTLTLTEVTVPEHRLLGEPGDQIWYVFNVVAPYFLIAMAGVYIGVAGRALQLARDHLRQRRHAHSGRLLADDPVLQYQLGDLWTTLAHSRQMVFYAARAEEAGADDALPALSAAKIDAARAAVEVTNGAMTLAGGRGYAAGGELERLLRNARAADVMSPTTHVLQRWIGRSLLDRNLLTDL